MSSVISHSTACSEWLVTVTVAQYSSAVSLTSTCVYDTGLAATELGTHTENAMQQVVTLGNRVGAQSAAAGALPTLYAATMPGAVSGDYYGPSGPLESRGAPRRVGSSRASRDETVARELWTLAEKLTGVGYL